MWPEIRNDCKAVTESFLWVCVLIGNLRMSVCSFLVPKRRDSPDLRRFSLLSDRGCEEEASAKIANIKMQKSRKLTIHKSLTPQKLKHIRYDDCSIWWFVHFALSLTALETVNMAEEMFTLAVKPSYTTLSWPSSAGPNAARTWSMWLSVIYRFLPGNVTAWLVTASINNWLQDNLPMCIEEDSNEPKRHIWSPLFLVWLAQICQKYLVPWNKSINVLWSACAKCCLTITYVSLPEEDCRHQRYHYVFLQKVSLKT